MKPATITEQIQRGRKLVDLSENLRPKTPGEPIDAVADALRDICAYGETLGVDAEYAWEEARR